MSLTQGINQRTLTIGGRMTEQLVFILRRLDLTNKKLFIYGETVESKRVKLETSRKPYGDPSPTVNNQKRTGLDAHKEEMLNGVNQSRESGQFRKYRKNFSNQVSQ